MKIRLIDGRILSGNNEVEIVTKMRELETGGGSASELSLEEYMKLLVLRAKELAETVKRDKIEVDYSYENFDPQLSGDIEEQCKNLIAAMVENRIVTVLPTKDELIAKIKNASPDDDNEFREIIAAVLDGGLVNVRTLANEFAVSRPSIDRWRRGKNCPHPAVRKPIFEFLIRILTDSTNS